MTEGPPIRDAATVILVRDAATAPRVLMGQRGQSAVFMPSKFVFPGGAVDAADTAVPLAAPLPEACRARLGSDSAVPPETLATAAIRELWEETGQRLSSPGDWPGAPEGWQGFATGGHRPDPSALRFIFRAVTPPGRPRRFDARFFLADAGALTTDPDDFGAAEDELSHLAWRPFDEIRALDLPFITEVVLGELAAQLPSLEAPASVPFFRNDDEAGAVSRFR